MKPRYALLGLATIGMVYGFSWASRMPGDAVQGESARIISVHVPTAWLAFLAFGMTAVFGIAWLVTKRAKLDHLAAASAEVGVLFTGLALITGMIWGKATWGIAWDWGDARLASTAMMFFVYLGYLALRRATPDPVQRARRSAVLGAVGALQVPLVYFSVNIWRTLHQTQSVRPDGASLPTETLISMLVNLAAFTVLYLGLLLWRADQLRVEEARLAQTHLTPNAGAAVVPPKLQPGS
jgi:heme exporter protein C